MTLQEAIKTGKPFRRSHWPTDDYLIDHAGYLSWYPNAHKAYALSVEALAADDWEIKADKRIITFDTTISSAVVSIARGGYAIPTPLDSPKPGTKVKVTLEWEE